MRWPGVRPPVSTTWFCSKLATFTGWGWTHPALSILLRERGSSAIVHNDPGSWQPFDPDLPIALTYRGACENRILAHTQIAKPR